jgi:hypothetical protein
MSFDAIAAGGALDTSAEDEAERWSAMDVAGRGCVSTRFGGADAIEDVGRVAGSEYVDCDDWGLEVTSMLRYFFIVGESGAAKL